LGHAPQYDRRLRKGECIITTTPASCTCWDSRNRVAFHYGTTTLRHYPNGRDHPASPPDVFERFLLERELSQLFVVQQKRGNSIKTRPRDRLRKLPDSLKKGNMSQGEISTSDSICGFSVDLNRLRGGYAASPKIAVDCLRYLIITLKASRCGRGSWSSVPAS
jgi:hypothetical protein